MGLWRWREGGAACAAALALALAGCGGGAITEEVAAKADVSTFKGNGAWWNPAESGSGFFFEAQGATGIVTFYAYEANGRPVWYTAAGPFTGSADGRFQFSGTLQRYAGGQPASSATPKAPASTSVGAASIVFNGETAQVQVPGRAYAAEKFNREGRHTPAAPGQPRTGGWWNPAEDGRGYVVEVADNRATIGVFHYAEDGQPTWHLVAIPLAGAGQAARGEFVAYSGGQTLAGAYKAPSSASQGAFNAQFTGACKGTLAFPQMAATPVERFSFGNLQGCSGDGPAPGAPATVGSYEFQTLSLPTAGLQSQAIAMGAKGFRLLDEIGAYNAYLYGKVSDNPITQELHTVVADTALHQAQLQALGNRGMRWAGRMGIDRNQLVFAKATDGSTFSYRVFGNSPDSLLAEMNQQGAEGYLKVQSTRDLRAYEKHTQSGARYGYEALALPADDAALAAQLKAQGDRGFRLMRVFFGDNRVYYEKDTTQAARFTYTVLPRPAAAGEFDAQLKAQAAQGKLFMLVFYYQDDRQRAIYYSTADCTGVLCEPYQRRW